MRNRPGLAKLEIGYVASVRGSNGRWDTLVGFLNGLSCPGFCVLVVEMY